MLLGVDDFESLQDGPVASYVLGLQPAILKLQ
jgi:hypothetical protein